MGRLGIAAALVIALAGTAVADIRSDDDPPRKPRVVPPPKAPEVVPPLPEGTEPIPWPWDEIEIDGGTPKKSVQAPEWVFALGVLGAGAWALRRRARIA